MLTMLTNTQTGNRSLVIIYICQQTDNVFVYRQAVDSSASENSPRQTHRSLLYSTQLFWEMTDPSLTNCRYSIAWSREPQTS